jgi:hypothetical protein
MGFLEGFLIGIVLGGNLGFVIFAFASINKKSK